MKQAQHIAFVAIAVGMGCDDPPDTPPPAPPPTASGKVTVSLPKLASRLAFEPERGTQRIGLPPGCRLHIPTYRAPLSDRTLRFLGDPHTEELVIATRRAEASVHSAVLPARPGEPLRPFPWEELDAPPPAARSAPGWIAALPGPPEGDLATLSLWREGAAPSGLAAGDRLTAWDAACSGETCAVLSTRVSKAAGAGASVFSGSAKESGSNWRRIDIHPGEDGELMPLSILDVSASGARVALASDTGVEVWEATAHGAKRLSRTEVAHEVFGVVAGEEAIVVTATEPVSRPCARDGIELSFVLPDGAEHTAPIPVAPDGLLARRLESGFIVAWVAPLSCRLTDRSMVHALLLDDSGRPRGSAMAVADATGFALTTDGATVTLWLHRGSAVSRVTGTCRLPPGDPPGASATPPIGSAFKSQPK